MKTATGLRDLISLDDDGDTTEASESDLLAGNMMYGYGALRTNRLPDRSHDDRSVHSFRSTRSHKRRCKDYQDGYDDDDDVGESKAQARAQRRASLKSSRRASMGSSKRRSSLSGGTGCDERPRRASLNMSTAQLPARPRRASLSNGMRTVDLAPARRVSLSSGVLPTGQARRASVSSGMRSADLGPAHRARRASLSGDIAVDGFNLDKVKYTKPKAGRRASFSGDPYNIDPYAGHPQSPETIKSFLPAMSAEDIKAALSPVAKKGINQDALARMNRRMSGQFHQEDEDSRHDSFQNLGYGYGYAPSQMPHQAAHSRRPSTSSRASAASHKSRRPSHRMPKEIASSHVDIESDLDNSDSEFDDQPSDKEYGYPSTNKANLDYGYGYGGKSGGGYDNHGTQAGLGYESDTRSHASSSSRASRRRNSCIIRPDQMIGGNAMIEASMYESDADSSSVRDDDVSLASHRVSRRNSCCIVESDEDSDAKAQDDLNDPDSLLSRSGFYGKQSNTSKPVNLKQSVRSSFGLANCGNVNEQEHEEEEDQDLLFENSKPVEKASVDVATSYRQKPFTTALPPKPQVKAPSALKNSIHRSWAELEFNSESDSSSASESDSEPDSERSYGSSLYEDPVQQEVDCYQQRARRRASLEAGCIDMRELLDSPRKHPELKKMPNFTPAEGCKIASDFIVRCFVARLRHGITIMKHNRNRWSKSQYRVLYLLPDGKSLTWKPLEGEKVKGKRPLLDLTKCIEVRHAWTKDPLTRKLTGTTVLRTHTKENMAGKSLSLIFHKRTLDMSALSTDLCKVLLEGFSALCFRLKLEKEELGGVHTNDCCTSSDDDFASTIYGGSTISMGTGITNATTSTPILPWGL